MMNLIHDIYSVLDRENKYHSIAKLLNILHLEIKSSYGGSIGDNVVAFVKELFDRWNHSAESRVLALDDLNKFSYTGFVYEYRSLIIGSVIVIINNYIKDVAFEYSPGPKLAFILNWYSQTLQTFVHNLLLTKETDHVFEKQLYLSFATYQARDIFSIIADFPQCHISLNELKLAIENSNSTHVVGKIFRKTLQKRLLHSGASTSQILDMYVATIRSLRLIDSSDTLLNYVANPIREYLKLRQDTVRCIVSMISKGRQSELVEELKHGGALEHGLDPEDVEEENGPGTNWQPSKRDWVLSHDTRTGSLNRPGLDVLALLVTIYGSVDLFVQEYKQQLCDRLLASLEPDLDFELTNLELLKIR